MTFRPKLQGKHKHHGHHHVHLDHHHHNYHSHSMSIIARKVGQDVLPQKREYLRSEANIKIINIAITIYIITAYNVIIFMF